MSHAPSTFGPLVSGFGMYNSVWDVSFSGAHAYMTKLSNPLVVCQNPADLTLCSTVDATDATSLGAIGTSQINSPLRLQVWPY
jgi:hypothetical protein